MGTSKFFGSARYRIAATLGLSVLLASSAPLHAGDKPASVDSAAPASVTSGCCSTEQTMWEVITGSVCGTPCCERVWTPLCCDTLLCEGWHESWISPPNGCGGAPRQGWINAFDGFFTREWHLAYAHADNLAGGGDGNVGLFQFQTPLSRRLWLGIDVPFVVSIDGGPADASDFGDMTLTPKVMVHETQDLSISGGVGIRIPTGHETTGGDLTSLFPHLSIWKDLGCGWAFHGGTGVEVPTESSVSPDGVWIANLAIGQTISEHDATPLGDFTYYLSTNIRQEFGSGDHDTFVSVTPGLRTHLGSNFFLLAGFEIPLTNPEPFDSNFVLLLVKGF